MRLRPARARAVGVVVVAILAFVLIGIAFAPRAISIRGSHRDYRASVVLRQQLGERLQALVEGLSRLEEQGRRLRERVERVERLYGLAVGPEDPEPPGTSGAPTSPATIFARLITQGNRSESRLRRALDRVDRALLAILEQERPEPRLARTIPARSPVSGENVVLSSEFGWRRSPFTHELELHTGLDFAAPLGTSVLAPSEGVVAWTGAVAPNRRGDWWRLGRTVVLRHGESYRTFFGHLDALAVRPGDRVEVGDPLGTVGETGWTSAPHLHYEVRHLVAGRWVAVDPRDHLVDAEAGVPDRPARRETIQYEPSPPPPEFLR